MVHPLQFCRSLCNERLIATIPGCFQLPLPIGAKAVWIEMDVPKVFCQKCSAKSRMELRFADPKRQPTRSFERYVMELLAFMTPQDFAFPLGISWDVANAIQKRRLGRRFARPKLKKVN